MKEPNPINNYLQNQYWPRKGFLYHFAKMVCRLKTSIGPAEVFYHFAKMLCSYKTSIGPEKKVSLLFICLNGMQLHTNIGPRKKVGFTIFAKMVCSFKTNIGPTEVFCQFAKMVCRYKTIWPIKGFLYHFAGLTPVQANIGPTLLLFAGLASKEKSDGFSKGEGC